MSRYTHYNKFKTYTDRLQNIRKDITEDQKKLLASNADPEKIADEINELKRVSAHISHAISSIDDMSDN